MIDKVLLGDSINLIKAIEDNSIDLILSDIPYGISIEEWDVIHSNTNSALLGTSPSQVKSTVFKKRGKPLNGWSEADKLIPKQYYEWCMSWCSEWLRVLKPCGTAFVFAGRRLAHRCISAFEDSGFIYKDMIGWNKGKAPHRAQHISCVFERRKDNISAKKWKNWKVGNLRPIFEPILWFIKPYKIGSTITDNILTYKVGAYNEAICKDYEVKADNLIQISSNSDDIGLHPTQKPLKLMEYLIDLVTIKDSIVLDPFMGSGTTCLAAKNLERHFIGFEQNEEYYTKALNRLENNKRKLF